ASADARFPRPSWRDGLAPLIETPTRKGFGLCRPPTQAPEGWVGVNAYSASGDYLPPSAVSCSALLSIEDGIESPGIDLSHLMASFGFFEVLSSVNGMVMIEGSVLLMPSAAATPLRRARRTIQVCASMLAIFGNSALLSAARHDRSISDWPT